MLAEAPPPGWRTRACDGRGTAAEERELWRETTCFEISAPPLAVLDKSVEGLVVLDGSFRAILQNL